MLLAVLALALRAAPTPAAAPIRITLERTTCFGTCPVYTVSLAEDGAVSYEGRQFVQVTGSHQWRVEPAAVRALAAEMEKAGFFDMKSEYTAPISDMPTTFTTLTIGSRTKRIRNYFDAPEALETLEKRIDQVSGARRWVHGDIVYDALARGDAAMVKMLLGSGISPASRDEHGVTLVMRAAMSGDPETVRVVVEAGGDRTARDLEGRNAADRVRDLIARDPGNPRLAAILRLLTDE